VSEELGEVFSEGFTEVYM